MADTDEAIVELQMKLSFQDSLLEDLNQVIIDQQDQIAKLELAVETIKVQMSTMQTSMQQGNVQQHEIPPHY